MFLLQRKSTKSHALLKIRKTRSFIDAIDQAVSSRRGLSETQDNFLDEFPGVNIPSLAGGIPKTATPAALMILICRSLSFGVLLIMSLKRLKNTE
jgi:hypothetical protein